LKSKYFVYDYIDTRRRYNIYRLENVQTNPYIRFKIVGGPHEGLSIRFSTIKENMKIHDHKIMSEFSMEKYKQAGLAWSSEIYTIDNPESSDKNKNQIYQNIQWAQVSEDGTYCRVIEFEITWPEDLEKMGKDDMEKITHHMHGHKQKEYVDHHGADHHEEDVDRFSVTPVGMKIVLFNDKLETVNNTNPFYSMYKDGKIIGTQWIPCTDRISKSYEKHETFYRLRNSNAKEFRYESDFVKSNFFYYYTEGDSKHLRGYTVIQSMVSDLLDDHIRFFEE